MYWGSTTLFKQSQQPHQQDAQPSWMIFQSKHVLSYSDLLGFEKLIKSS